MHAGYVITFLQLIVIVLNMFSLCHTTVFYLNFRCKLCHSALLPGSYTQGRDAASLICSHHITDGKNTSIVAHALIGSTGNSSKYKFETGFLSLSGVAITSVPHYPDKTQDRLLHRTVDKAEKGCAAKDNKNSSVVLKSVVKPTCPNPPRLRVKDKEGAGKTAPASILADSTVQQEVTKTEESSELSSATEGNSRPVPTPRHMMQDSSAAPVPAPVPAPRTKTLQKARNSPTAGNTVILYYYLSGLMC